MSGRNRYGVYRREREHRRWFGDEKLGYVTEDEAWAIATHLNRVNGGGLRVEYYQCGVCPSFHVGKRYPGRPPRWPAWWWRNNHEIFLVELGERALGCLGVENSQHPAKDLTSLQRRIAAAHRPRKGIANHFSRRRVRTR